MITVIIGLALCAIFADSLGFKLGAWYWLAERSAFASKLVDCEFCRSWWTAAALAYPVCAALEYYPGAPASLVIAAASTALKLVLENTLHPKI